MGCTSATGGGAAAAVSSGAWSYRLSSTLAAFFTPSPPALDLGFEILRGPLPVGRFAAWDGRSVTMQALSDLITIKLCWFASQFQGLSLHHSQAKASRNNLALYLHATTKPGTFSMGVDFHGPPLPSPPKPHSPPGV